MNREQKDYTKKIKNLFFEKINKVDKPLTRVTKKKRIESYKQNQK